MIIQSSRRLAQRGQASVQAGRRSNDVTIFDNFATQDVGVTKNVALNFGVADFEQTQLARAFINRQSTALAGPQTRLGRQKIAQSAERVIEFL